MKDNLMEYLRNLFREYPGNEKRGVFFTKMLLWYAACTILVYLIFGSVMSALVQKNYKNQISQLNERAIAQSVSACSTTLRNLYNYYYLKVLESAELTDLLLAEEYSPGMALRFKKLNTELMGYSDLVSSCYVINLKDGFVCSTLDTYQSTEDFPDRDIIRQLELIRDVPGEYVLVPRRISYEMRGIRHSRQYISLIFKKYREGYLVINLDYEAFADMVNYRNYDSSSRALLLNNMGLVLADSSEALFGTEAVQEEYYMRLMEQKDRQGSFVIRTEDGRKKVLYDRDQLFGISYLILTDEKLFGTNTLLFQMLFCSVTAVAANLLLILIGTCVLYRPIYRLQSMFLPQAQTEEIRVDEFKAMEQMLRKMRKITWEYSQSRRKKLLKELLEDKRLHERELNEELLRAREQLGRAIFLCVNLYPATEEEKSPDDLILMKFCMENILKELLEKWAIVESVDYGSYLTCILNLDSLDGQAGESEENARTHREDIVARALRGMQEKMEDFFGVDVTCSIGTVVNSLDDIAESYEAALVAAFFQMTKEKNAILYSGMPAEENAGEQEYPGETVREIMDGIKAGDKGKIRRELSVFFSAMTSVSYHHAVKCIMMLEMETVKLEMRYGAYYEKGNLDFPEGLQSGRLYKMQEACLEHCLSAADACAERRDNNPNMVEIVERVKELVEQKLTDHNLCVNSVAQEIYLSAGYVRAIFKEVTGQTLSNYIIERKLAMVCRLLKETDWSVQQIAEHMEFSSRSYLYTFFKNYMGMTPNQYRKQKTGDMSS